MTTREQIMEALYPIKEATTGKSLVELGWIRDMMVKEQAISLTVVVLEDHSEIRAKLTDKIQNYLEHLGQPEVHIRFREATEHEKAALTNDQSHAQRPERPAPSAPEKPPIDAEFIAISSGKGGVGKSTVTVNLAAALARQGVKVGIIDADIYGFSVPDMMGIEERPKVEGETVYPVERLGVKVMSMGFFVEDNAPVVWRGPMLGKMLRNFLNAIEWGELDIVLLDLPPGTGDIALDVHQMLPSTKEILVTTPHPTAAFVAARAGAMAVKTEHEILGVVENMAYLQCEACGEKQYVFGRGGGAKLAEELHTKLLAQIPLGTPVQHPQSPNFAPSVYEADHEIGQLYDELALSVKESLGI